MKFKTRFDAVEEVPSPIMDMLRDHQARISELTELLAPLIEERIKEKLRSLVMKDDPVIRGQIQELYFFRDWPRILAMELKPTVNSIND
jgi:hypothetical protein